MRNPKPMPGKSKKFKMAESAKTQHPGKTEMERKILDQIGCGGYNLYEIYKTDEGREAVANLAERGDIQKLTDLKPDEFNFQMSIPIHMIWCKWGRDNCEDDDDGIGVD